ncbi:MAG: thiamine phosphate synthase [Nitrospira sp.]|uniref:Thiamine-phosphate synthase n=1 Tax=Nitrospira defluvii TaxID=330214 RepID=A0ABN7MHL9_9BACT|nr:thiamine phosphate synthase [Nitrospira defluvii]MCS6326815.1 thiamine phosphate synthase [Nitrospira sp.]CAE6803079.1 Putative thiamine-phosphate synthase [Nitrospira defluvii]
MPAVDFRLYLVTDRHQTAGRPLLSVLREAVSAGVRAVQLRERDLPIRDLRVVAGELQTELRQAKLFINDRVDLALALSAHGVHLRESSLPVAVVRGLLQPSQLLGASVHSIEGALAAEQQGADFVVLGPIHDTPSKREYGAPLGLAALERAARSVRIPIFAIGGMTADRARDARQAGAFGVAVLSSILSAADVGQATTSLLSALEHE